MPAESSKGMLFTKRDYYRDPNGLPDLETLQSNLDTEHDLGVLKVNLNVKGYADLSVIQEAGARLK